MALISVLLYFLFAYNLVRTDFTQLIFLYTALFILFYSLVRSFKNNPPILTWFAFAFRVILILAIPNLSQDFYRFIWDGRMLVAGYNPYLQTVEAFISNQIFPVAQAEELYKGMGMLNASHFTNYPPINQLCFALAALLASKNILGAVVVLRLIIIAADFGTLYFGKKLLENLKIPIHNMYWYILNPFIIIELTGNLHFEVVMIFFLVWSLYLLQIGKWQFSAVFLGFSVATKLIPLIFLPLYFGWFFKNRSTYNLADLKKLMGYYLITIATTVLLFAPFFSVTFIKNYSETIALWFQNFEFNASLYYLARSIGYLFRGYNEIAFIGKVIPVLVIVFVLIITFFKRHITILGLISNMVLVLSFYYFTATTVHPWYIATLLILSVFSNYKFPLIWSFVIMLSYFAYSDSNTLENLWVVSLEYLIVYTVFIWEVFINKKAMTLES